MAGLLIIVHLMNIMVSGGRQWPHLALQPVYVTDRLTFRRLMHVAFHFLRPWLP